MKKYSIYPLLFIHNYRIRKLYRINLKHSEILILCLIGYLSISVVWRLADGTNTMHKFTIIYLFTPQRSHKSVIFSLEFVCVFGSAFEQKFQPNELTDLDAVFAKWLLTTLARTLLTLVILEWYGSIFIYRRYPANSCSFRWSMF